jgi:hypothetical protein
VVAMVQREDESGSCSDETFHANCAAIAALPETLADLTATRTRVAELEAREAGHQRTVDALYRDLAALRERLGEAREALETIAEYDTDFAKGPADNVAALQTVAERALARLDASPQADPMGDMWPPPYHMQLCTGDDCTECARLTATPVQAAPPCPCVAGPACRPTCTCANPVQSGGCLRCSNYGAATPVQGAPPCRCGSGLHPRRCELHPNRYAEHCAEISAESVQAAPADGPTPRDCIHGRRTCEPCAWTAGYPRELLQGGAAVWKLRDFDGEQWRDVPADGPTCAAWCGTMYDQHTTSDCAVKAWGNGSRCYCTKPCRDAGRPLRPVLKSGTGPSTLAEELESAAFVLDEAIGTAAYGHKGAAIVGSVLAARLRARAARARELMGLHEFCSDSRRENRPCHACCACVLRDVGGPDLGPTRRGEPA